MKNVAFTLCLITLAGCNNSLDGLIIPMPAAPVGRAALLQSTSCADIHEAVVQQQLYELDLRLRANEIEALQWDCTGYATDAVAPGVPLGAASPTASAPGATSAGATQVSTTNVQVAGVDEPDFVKNDNQFIYDVSNGALHIVAAYPAASMHEVARVPLEGEPRALFVTGDTAVVYVARGASSAYANAWSTTSCTYGYSCEPTGDGTSTTILVFDIHDRTSPVQVRRLDIASSYMSARRVGTAVYTVFSMAPPASTYARQWPGNIDCNTSKLDIIRAFNKLREQDIAAIRSANVATNLPTGRDSAAATVDMFGDCTDVLRSGIADGDTVTSIVSFDMADNRQAAQVLSVLGRPGFTYASADALYLAVRHTPASGTDFASAYAIDPNEISTVHKFALDANTRTASYVATGVMPGHVINQFSMDERNGNLRVASTHGMVADTSGDFNAVSSSVTVLAQQGNALVRIAGIDSIAPDEDIRAVRFDGDRGYVCTFKKTDPLFVFDLSNPKAPKQLGALQVPGFSTYMQMMDANHLLTIGYDANDMGTYALFEGILLQIFDVTDPTNPQQLYKEDIGTRGSSSAALTDHLAFNYFPEEQLLALPVTICDQYGSATLNGLRVYHVSVGGGFQLQGQIASAQQSSSNGYADNLCGNWWSNATSTVQRSVIMDNDVYAVSRDVLQVDDLGSLGSDIARVTFTAP